MKPFLIYSNTSEIAKSVKYYLKSQGSQYVREFLWNRSDPKNTEWWLIPGPKHPSYEYGKLFFTSDIRRVPDDCFFCGLLVEKGLDKSALGIFKNELIMKKDWIWHEIFNELGTDKFSSAFEKVSKKSKAPVRILLEAGIEKGQTPAYFNRTWPDVCGVTFTTYDGSSLDLQPNYSIHLDYSNLIERISIIKSINDLKYFIENELTEIKFVWQNLYLGIYLRKGSDPPKKLGAWDAEQLWDNALSPWASWFK